MTALVALPWGPSVNHYWLPNANGSKRLSVKGEAYRVRVAAALLAQTTMAGAKAPPPPWRVVITLYPPRAGVHDLDNFQKAMFDALTAAAWWPDDSLVDDFRVKRGPVLKYGLAVVEVEHMEPVVETAAPGLVKLAGALGGSEWLYRTELAALQAELRGTT